MPSTSNNDVVTLTDDEKDQIIELWEAGVHDAKALTSAIFPGKDGRSKEGVAVKTFLGSKNLKAKVSSEYEKKEISLDENEKQFIESFAGTHKPLEIARLLFHNQKLTNLDAEGRAVLAYYNTLDPKMRFLQADEEGGSEMQEYKAPRNVKEAITKVNRYADMVDESKMSQTRRDELSYLVKFMNTHRYVYAVNKLASEQERNLFESSFVRFVHNKPDLTQEDIDLYINLCGDIISHDRMMSEEKTLRAMLLDNDDEEGGKKINMATVEYISQLRKDIGSNLARQKKTLEDLNSKRSDRRKQATRESASMMNFVEAWKDKGLRDRIIHHQQLRKQLNAGEVDRLASMPGIMFEIFGVGTEEAL